MNAEPAFRTAIVPGVGALPADAWTACFPGEAEGWDYYRACGNDLAAAVFDDRGMVLGVPLFRMEYRLDTPLQGRAAAVAQRLGGAVPGLMRWGMLGVGSPLTERCHVAVRPGLSPQDRARALPALLALLEGEAARSGARLVVFKDVAGPDAGWLAPALGAHRYTAVASLPVAVLDLGGYDEAGYLASLSPATRKDLKRKLKSRARLRIEHRSGIDGIDGIAAEIDALYDSTRRNSQVRYGAFEDLPDGYFRNVARTQPDRTRFVLYWVGDRLAAFNLLLVQPDRVIDKFLGMAYPLAREHNLYAVSWMENVRFAMESRRPLLQVGQTAYASKLRFGSHLAPSTNFVHCRTGALNQIIRWTAPWLALDRWDPDLQAFRDRRPDHTP